MARIVWTDVAADDVRDIFDYIALDAPRTALLFIEDLIKSTDRLEVFPLSGRMIPEIDNSSLREIVFRNYRLIYRFQNSLVEILHVYHTARDINKLMLD